MPTFSLSTLLTTRTVWMLGLGALVLGGVASGQARRPDATLDELVVEVQAMRAEMNQAASASIRAQLLVGRLQMEDQRITSVLRELEAAQDSMTSNGLARAEAAARLKRLEEVTLGATNDVREDLEKQVAAARTSLQQLERRQELLKRRESVLTKELEEDQARWQQINLRLEHFEQEVPLGR